MRRSFLFAIVGIGGALVMLAGGSDSEWVMITLVITLLLLVLIAASSLFNFDFFIGQLFAIFPSERDWISELYDYTSRALTTDESLVKILSERTSDAGPIWLRHRVRRIVKLLSEGKTLSQAITKYPAVFPPSDRAIIEVGEKSGKLPEALAYLASTIRAKRSDTYPGWLIFAELSYMVVIVSFVMIVIIPKFKEIFDQLGGELPWLTQSFITFTWIVAHNGAFWGVLAVLILYILFRTGVMDRIISVTPLFSRLYWGLALSRFSFALGAMLQSGATINGALPMAVLASRNRAMRRRQPKIMENLENGVPLDTAISGVPGMPREYVWYLNAGLKRETPELTLLTVSSKYRDDYELASYQLGAIMLPATLVIIGAICAWFLVAMYLPLFNIPKLVGGE